MANFPRLAVLGFALAASWLGLRAAEPTLDEVWSSPPAEAKIRAYWWWLNGNVDRAAITRDLEQMKAKGFGGAIICDAGGAEQRGNDRVPAGPTFGSPEWKALLRHTLAEGDRLGLELSLNIQSGWNLGGPGVPVDDAVKKLVTSEQVVDGAGAEMTVLPDPPRVGGYYRDLFVLAYKLRGDGKHSGGVAHWKQRALEEKIQFTGANAWFLTNSAPKTEVLVAAESDHPGEEDVAAADVIDLTPDLQSDGRLRWHGRPGRWQVIRIGCTLGDVHEVSTHSDGWAGYAIDVFDAGAFQRYWDTVVGPLLAEMRPYTGRSLRYLHTDSWEVDLVNWTPTLREEFRRRRGYDPLPYLPAFTGRIVGSRRTTDRFLNDYRRTLGDLALENHYRQFKERAASFGLLIHPESGGPHYTPIDAQQCLGLNDVPMSEFWAQSATHRSTEDVRFFVKQPASAAHTYGHRFVAAEGFTSIGPHWQETLWDNLKPSFDHALSEGLNRLVWHAFVCSPASMGIPGQQYFAGTHFNPNVTWWPYAEPFVAYLNRCQAMLQRGRPTADVLYYYGDHVPNFAQSRASDPAAAGKGFDYDVITADALIGRVTVHDGLLTLPEGGSYRLLVLPERTEISPAVLRKVRDLVAAGATVIGPKPTAASTLSGQRAADDDVRTIAETLWGSGRPGAAVLQRDGAVHGRVISDRKARAVLEADGVPPDVALVNEGTAELDWIHRRDGDADLYFVANRRNAEARTDVRFRAIGRAPELWNAVTGERRLAEYRADAKTTTVPIALPPYGSLFVVFRRAVEGRPASAGTERWTTVADLGGDWQVAFDPKWGGPAQATFSTLVSWTERSEPGIKYYSGTATYRRRFEVTAAILADGGKVAAPRETLASAPERGEVTPPTPDLTSPSDKPLPATLDTSRTAATSSPLSPSGRPARVWLDLGLVRELAAVRVNGKDCGIVWAPPFRVDISAAIQAGENRLEIDVVNFWPNRIIGDASLPVDRRLTRTNITQLKAGTPLMKSGLFGPVTLLRSE